jgi:hypothetical protein
MKLFKDSLMSNQKLNSLEIQFKEQNPILDRMKNRIKIDPQTLSILFNGSWKNKTLKSLRLNCKKEKLTFSG